MKKIIILISTMMLLICGGCSSNSEDTSKTNNDTSTNEVVNNIEDSIYKSNLTVDKQETVNVKTKADGTVYETSVEVVLKNPLDGNSIKDKTNLTNIVNTEGDEEYTSDGEYIYWNNANQDIHYKGESNEELPVSIKITYYLDGSEISPSDLAGKSGHVKIRFDYLNNTSVNNSGYDVEIPFICLTMLYLPSDNFYNISSDDSEIMDMDDSTLIVGMGFPGLKDSLKLDNNDFGKDIDLKEYFEVEADVVDFELDYTATIVSNGLFQDLKDDDFKDIDDMLEKVDDIDNQKKDIDDSKDDLNDASSEFNDLVDKLAGYVTTLNDYAQTMYNNYSEVLPLLMAKMSELNKIMNTEGSSSSSYVYSFNTDETAIKKEIAYYTNLLNNGSTQQIRQAASSALKIANYYYASVSLIAYSDGLSSKLDTSSLKTKISDSFNELIDVLDEFEDNIDSLTDNIDSGLKETINRLKATRNVDKQYNNFSGLVDGKQGSTMFIIQSDEIK